jgi:hypothetical protein
MCAPSFASDDGESLITNNPIEFLSRELKPTFNKDREFLVGRIHGDLHTQNILRDSEGVVWVVDWRHFSTSGHFATDFSRLTAEILACIDFNKRDALQFGKILTNIVKNSIQREELETDTYPSDVAKAICAIFELQSHYLRFIEKSDVGIGKDRQCGEYKLGLFLNLISAASRTKASKLGGELCIYYAGLLTEDVRNYIKMAL